MLTTDDIIKFSNFLKEDMKTTFATKEEMNAGFEEMNRKFSQLITSVDGIAKENKRYHEEMVVMGYRVSNLEQKVG